MRRSGTTSTSKGASFFHDLYQAAGGGDPEAVLDSLWDLVWAGEVTNDTLAPLRAYVQSRGRPSAPGLAPSSAPTFHLMPRAAGRSSRCPNETPPWRQRRGPSFSSNVTAS